VIDFTLNWIWTNCGDWLTVISLITASLVKYISFQFQRLWQAATWILFALFWMQVSNGWWQNLEIVSSAQIFIQAHKTRRQDFTESYVELLQWSKTLGKVSCDTQFSFLPKPRTFFAFSCLTYVHMFWIMITCVSILIEKRLLVNHLITLAALVAVPRQSKGSKLEASITDLLA